ncbi:metallophosphoesterase [Candidatus Woesearchaeota archaeon]|nr:metallophosphoesterase [Candidatus Woesearchaeota archaeon]
MEIHPGIEIKDLSLYLKKENALIFSDFHLGYEQALRKQGVLVPQFQFQDIVKRVEASLENKKYSAIIVTGDLKHEFGVISETEWRHILQLLDLFAKHAEKILLIKGNHDPVLGPIARKRNVEVVPYVKYDTIFICHGDHVPESEDFQKSKIIIIGHEHPAITLHEGAKREKYKCFLKGKYRGKTLLVLPSFNLLTTGTDVSKEKLLSPFLQQDLSEFEVWINEKSAVYYFGKIKGIL